MKFDIHIGDCWIDERGIHWFCKIIQTMDDSDLGLNYMSSRMVRYMDKGLNLLSREQFQAAHPSAQLYLRNGKHPT